MVFIVFHFVKIFRKSGSNFLGNCIIHKFRNQEITFFFHPFFYHFLIIYNIIFNLFGKIGDESLMVVFIQNIFNSVSHDLIDFQIIRHFFCLFSDEIYHRRIIQFIQNIEHNIGNFVHQFILISFFRKPISHKVRNL